MLRDDRSLATIRFMRALMGGVLIGLVVGLVFQELRHGNLRKVNQQLQVDVAELQRQIDMRPQGTIAPASARLTEEERSELLRLRNQAAQLRSATNELQQLRAQLARSGRATGAGDLANSSSAPTGEIIPRESWKFAGYATPEAALHSLVFAVSAGDNAMHLQSLTGEGAEKAARNLKNQTPEEFAEEGRRGGRRITGYHVLERHDTSPEETLLIVLFAGEGDLTGYKVRKVGEEWKVVGGTSPKIDRP